MIEQLSPYTKMQPCALPGVEEIPAHWTTAPLAAIARPKKDINLQERELLSVYLHLGVIRFSDIKEKRTNATSKDLSKYQGVEPGDFVLNNQQAWRGSVGVSRHRGIISPAYLVLALNEKLNSSFANLLFRERSMVSQYLMCSKGVGSIQRNLYWPQLKRVATLIPPPDEQAAIAKFLGHANRKIGRYIQAKRKLIKLLEEQKQVIIHRAVTQGLDPNVRMKPSGVDWLGDVPEHWDLVPNKAHLRIRKVLVGSRHTEYQLLSLTKQGVIVRDISSGKGKFSSDMGTSQEVRFGDIVFCLFDVPETPRTVGLSLHDGMITGAYTVMECRDPKVAQFLELFYKAMDDRKLLSPMYSGLRNTIPKNRLLGAKTPIPPPDEINAIIDYVATSTSEIEASIALAHSGVELLSEYRTRLTADVVTGKLDVREAAAKLPELTSDDDLTDADLELDDDAFEEDDA